jgi:N-acetylglucosamine-6-phosphate deacetylase
MAEIVLAGADLVLPDRILTAGTLVVDRGCIVEVRQGSSQGGPGPGAALHGHLIVPGFVDAHIHGLEGFDTLDPGDPVAQLSVRLPRYGVTAFSPTSVTAAPAVLSRFLRQVRQARSAPQPGAARVLPAHIEGPFLHPDHAGAQDAARILEPHRALEAWNSSNGGHDDGGETLQLVEDCVPDVGVVTLAPETAGGLRLVEWLARRGIRPSMGHSSATYDEAMAAIAAGASRATHLFNCMPPLRHREPGLAGAVLQAPEVTAELIVDGVHVHPAFARIAIAAKGPSLLMAVTDGTALSGYRAADAALGGRRISARDGAARLDDGRLAGSIATMDHVFRMLVGPIGVSPVEAAAMCATTPARACGVTRSGALVRDAAADLAVLDRNLEVVQTYVGGQLAYARARRRRPSQASM